MPFRLVTEEEKPESRGRFMLVDEHTGELMPSLVAGPEPTMMEKVKDYFNIRKPKTTPLELEAIANKESPYWIREEVFETGRVEELRRIVGRGLSGVTGTVSDLVRGYEERPETVPGTVIGAGLELAGFFLGPFKGAKAITGTRLAPTASGLKGMTQLMIEGGATLGIASGISSILPAFLESESFTEMGKTVLDHTKTGTMVGMLFPLTGVIPTKPLRLAVGLAVMDKIRAGVGEWFTIDDVYRGLADGTIDHKVLAERAFGYLMDLYFISKVPSMGKQLGILKSNAMVSEMKGLNAGEIETTLMELGKQGLLKPTKPSSVSEAEMVKAFGSLEEFGKTFKATLPDGGDMAQRVERMYNEADVELSRLRKGSLKEVGNRVAATTWDISANVKKALLKEGGDLGKEAVIRHDLIRGAGPKADLAIQEASNAIYKDLSKGEEITLNRIIQSRRTIAIDKYKKGIKHPGGFNDADHQMYLEGLPKETLEKLSPRADRYFAEMKNQLTQLKDEGLVTQEGFEALSKAGDYSPRRFIQYLDPERTFTFGAKKIPVTNSGIKSLEEGSYRNLENNSRLLLAQVVTRTQARIFRNRANQALYELAKQVPDNKIISLAKRIGVPKRPKKPTPLEKIVGEEYTGKALDRKIIDLKSQIWDFWDKHATSGTDIWATKAKQAERQLAKLEEAKKLGKPGILVEERIEKPERIVRFQKAPAGHEKISVMIEGKVHEMIMPQELAKEWIVNDPAINTQLANIIGWVSGSKILKPMATGINPEFALTNLPRDIAHAWITTHEFSPHGPLAALQMAKDFAKVAGDTVMRKGSYIDYIQEGGGMAFLTHQGRVVKRGGVLGTLQDVLGYAGETSEIWTRLALRNRALTNGKAPHEATWIARNYLDFSQGGQFIKAVDTAVPYLNAGVQGTRGIFRAAKEKPEEFIYKVGQLGVLASGLHLANMFNNPECLAQVSARDKVNNWIITTPFYYINETGDKRYLYFKIAKDQGQRIFATIFETMMAKFMGEDIDTDQVVQAAKDFIPMIPTEMIPPTLDAMMGYYANKDFWRNEDIWRGPTVIASQEYTNYTHPAMVEVGELTGLSPERLKYVLEQYFTYGNIYTSLVGGGLSQIMENLPEDARDQAMEDMLRQAPFLRRVLKSTDPYTKFEKEIKDTKIEENTRLYEQTRELDTMAEKYYGARTPEGLQEVKSFINQQPWQDKAKLIRRFTQFGKLYEIPDRRWWLNLDDMTPEGRAVMFWSRWQQADKKERQRLERYLKIVPGIVSKRFFIKLGQLKKRGSR